MNLKEAEAAERRLPEGWVIAVHPDLENSYTEVTTDALEEVMVDQGWEQAHLINPDTGETYSEEERVALANADAERRAAEQAESADAETQPDGGKPAEADAAAEPTAEAADNKTSARNKKEQ